MIKKPQVREQRVRRLLSQMGPMAAISRSLDELDRPVSEVLTRDLRLDPAERIMVIAGATETGWCVLTTERLVWSASGEVRSLGWSEVAGVQQPPDLSARIIRGEVPKESAEELEVFDACDGKYTLKLPPGPSYYFVWSTIAAIGNITRSADIIDLSAH
jgi:hypothetical protein